MPKLTIQFYGLCMFVFNSSIKNGGPRPTEARVLLPKLTRARQLRHVVNGRNEVLDQHFPFLELDLKNRGSGSDRKLSFLLPDSENGEMTKGVCLLFGDDIEIRPDGKKGSGLSVVKDAPRDRNWRTAKGDDRDTLWWLATLEDAFPNGGRVRKEFYQNEPGPNEAILTRVLLDVGKLRTDEVTDESCMFVHPGSPTFSQPVATHLALDVDFERHVEIVMTRRENGEPQERKLVLVPQGDKMEIDQERRGRRDDRDRGPVHRPAPGSGLRGVRRAVGRPSSGSADPIVRKIGPHNAAGNSGSVCRRREEPGRPSPVHELERPRQPPPPARLAVGSLGVRAPHQPEES